MSANREFESTKLPHDDNTDSGFLSGECSSGPCELSGEVDSGLIPDYDEKKLIDIADVSSITERLSSVNVCESTISPEQRSSDIPPLSILFQQDDDGDTQLHIASVHGCEKSVSTLIRVCPERTWLDVPNDYGHTPLHLAVMSGNAVVTRMLVIAGASLGVRDHMGETPLHKATARHLECLKALLAQVPEHQSRKLSTVLDQKNYNGQSCVHLAAAAGSVETLQTLIYYGADINSAENLAGWTALHIAARRGDARVAQYLRARGAAGAQLLRARDYAGRTPRRLARHTKAEKVFANDAADSDSDSDESMCPCMYDSDNETLFEKLRDSMNPINVA